MKITVTGATGFIGRRLVSSFLNDGHEVTIIARKGSEHKLSDIKSIRILTGLVTNEKEIKGLFKESDSVVHLVGILREFTKEDITFEKIHFQVLKNVATMAKNDGIRRFILISAIGASPFSMANYLRSKFICEEYLKTFKFDYTIIRAPLVYGPGDKATVNLINLIKRSPLIPLIGKKQVRIFPLYVDDLTEGIKHTLINKESINKTFDIKSPAGLTYKEMTETLAVILNKKVSFITIPALIVKTSTKFFEKFRQFPLCYDQIVMMNEEPAKAENFQNFFGLNFVNYKEGIARTLKMTGLK